MSHELIPLEWRRQASGRSPRCRSRLHHRSASPPKFARPDLFLDLARQQHLATLSDRRRCFYPFDEPYNVIGECFGVAKGCRIEDQRQHVVDQGGQPSAPRVARMPAGERTRQDFAEERQARTLVAAEGQDGAGRFGVEGLGVGCWSASFRQARAPAAAVHPCCAPPGFYLRR